MKNILVPTDFSMQSLNIVHAIVDKHPKQQVRIYLVHLLHIPVDVMDLMFLKAYRQQQQVPDAFYKAVQDLRDGYPTRIASIGLELYYGNRASVLYSIMENRKIDAIYLVEDYAYKLPLKDSVDMIQLIDRCKVPVHRMHMNGKVLMKGEYGKVSATFFKPDYVTVM